MIRIIIVISFIGALIFACGNDSNNESPTKKTAKAVDGKKIYQRNCVVCHGVYGDMGASGSFDLTESGLSKDEVIAVITKGRNAMTPWESILSEEEIKAVAEYSMTLRK